MAELAIDVGDYARESPTQWFGRGVGLDLPEKVRQLTTRFGRAVQHEVDP